MKLKIGWTELGIWLAILIPTIIHAEFEFVLLLICFMATWVKMKLYHQNQ